MNIETILDNVNKAVQKKDINLANDLLQLLDYNKELIKDKVLLASCIESLLEITKNQETGKQIPLDVNTVIYDFSRFDSHKISWRDLWDKSTYNDFASFFYNCLLKKFHKCPDQDIQHPIMACFALYNVAAIPNEGKKANAICSGLSRTGKSKYAERCMQLLPKKWTATIKGNSSPKAITEKIHNVCYLSGDENDLLVRPSVTRFDNIYWDDFIKRLDIHYVTLLALEKDDAICEIAGKDGGKYHTFSKYVFTTVEQPVRENPRMDELLNRSFCFYFDKGYEPDEEPSLYNWNGIENEYLELWDKESVEEHFFSVLSDVMKVTTKSCSMTLEQLEISRIMIATGLYLGIFEDIDSALTAFDNYWQYCLIKQDNVGNLLYKLCNNYLQKYYYYEIDYAIKMLKMPSDEAVSKAKFTFQHLMDYLNEVSNRVIKVNQKITKDIEDIMIQHDLILKETNEGLSFVKRKFL